MGNSPALSCPDPSPNDEAVEITLDSRFVATSTLDLTGFSLRKNPWPSAVAHEEYYMFLKGEGPVNTA
jgi:hypothetical protein